MDTVYCHVELQVQERLQQHALFCVDMLPVGKEIRTNVLNSLFTLGGILKHIFLSRYTDQECLVLLFVKLLETRFFSAISQQWSVRRHQHFLSQLLLFLSLKLKSSIRKKVLEVFLNQQLLTAEIQLSLSVYGKLHRKWLYASFSHT